MRNKFRILSILSLLAATGMATVYRPLEIPFAKHEIDLGSAETAAFADVNGDGKPDLISGEYWYESPHWTKHKFRDIDFVENYIDDLSTWPLDVDGDGKPDVVTSGWFTKRLAWWRNPGKNDAKWEMHPITVGSEIEFSFLVDLNNDGKAEEVLPQFGDHRSVAWYELDKRGGFVEHVVSPQSFGHGIGAGDVNGDGRTDILVPKGWLEAPPDPRQNNWKLHTDWNLDGLIGFMHVYDVNKDGRPDVITTMAHDYGIFWLENRPDGTWVKHMIDDSWSEGHDVTLVDLRKTGNLGLLTGKRFLAHNGRDPGAHEPNGIYWYERLIDPQTHAVSWAKHIIDYGTRTGGGIQIAVGDIDKDGDTDFAVGGKSGLYLFENKTR
jgi:hypothetical protein